MYIMIAQGGRIYSLYVSRGNAADLSGSMLYHYRSGTSSVSYHVAVSFKDEAATQGAVVHADGSRICVSTSRCL